MTGYTRNTRGRYKCDFCDHKTYKHASGVMTHLEARHPDAYKAAQANAKLQRQLEENSRTIERLKNLPPEIKERIVYRDPPAAAKPEYWDVPGIYCSTCKQAWRGGRIPRGQTVENTPHSVCGMKTLMLVLEIN